MTVTFGICMCKDEVDIILHTVARMLAQVDHVLIADNGSTDGTREILQALPITIVDDPDPAYFQSQKMSHLAAQAGELGADWVVPFDADEAWYSPHGRIGDILDDLPDYTAIATADLYDHVATAQDDDDPDPTGRICWRRRAKAPLQKVVCRPSVPVTIHQGNHGASFATETHDRLLVVRHFPYRSPEQFVSKVRNGAAAYAATDLPADAGAHWRQYGEILRDQGPQALEGVFREWFWSGDPASDTTLMFDPCP